MLSGWLASYSSVAGSWGIGRTEVWAVVVEVMLKSSHDLTIRCYHLHIVVDFVFRITTASSIQVGGVFMWISLLRVEPTYKIFK